MDNIIDSFRDWHKRRYALRERSFGVVPYVHVGGQRLYLVIHQLGGHWGFPKGHADHHETAAVTAARELFEETGLTAKLDTGRLFEQHYLIRRPIGPVPKTVVYFVGEAESQEVTIQATEVIGYAWLPLKEAIERIDHRNSRDILVAADAYLNQTS